MQLISELLSNIVANELLDKYLPNVQFNATELAESAAIRALNEIRIAIGNDSLSDFDCVEKIVVILENYGSGGGGRHDF